MGMEPIDGFVLEVIARDICFLYRSLVFRTEFIENRRALN